jgi:putative tricarboxylic transport membrane protein
LQTTIGSFSVGGGINDPYLMLGVGFVAFFMNMLRYPIAPLVIGVILGGLFDETFRRSLLISEGDLSVFISRPGAAILLALNVALILSQLPIMRRLFARMRRKVI